MRFVGGGLHIASASLGYTFGAFLLAFVANRAEVIRSMSKRADYTLLEGLGFPKAPSRSVTH